MRCGGLAYYAEFLPDIGPIMRAMRSLMLLPAQPTNPTADEGPAGNPTASIGFGNLTKRGRLVRSSAWQEDDSEADSAAAFISRWVSGRLKRFHD